MDQAVGMAEHLLDVAGIDFDTRDRTTQAVVGTFIFGMLNAYGMSAGQTPQELINLAVKVFQDALHYTPEAAGEGIQHCIEATRPGAHDTMKALIHRGVDGHRQYIAGDHEGLSANINSILAHFSSKA